MAEERLQKLLAQAGVASRRAAETLIVEGRVRVNGRVVTVLGAKADLHRDRVEVDGKRIVAEKPAYYLLHKPRGVVTTLDDPEGRETIAGLLRGIPERVFPVGRLDYHTSGVLLMTNDGAMAQALLHPKKAVPKTYVVKIKGSLDVPQLDALRNGVDIGNGERTQKAELFVLREEGENSWLQITITEGKNRQIHRMLEAVGRRVARLSRVSFANLTVEGLRPGDYRMLTGSELQKLKRDYYNPAKRANADAARQEAIDAAMQDLGYAPMQQGRAQPHDQRDPAVQQDRAVQGGEKREPSRGPRGRRGERSNKSGQDRRDGRDNARGETGNTGDPRRTRGGQDPTRGANDNARGMRGNRARSAGDQGARDRGKPGKRPSRPAPQVLRRRSPGPIDRDDD